MDGRCSGSSLDLSWRPVARTGKKERYAKEEEVRARCRESYERIKRLGNKREQWLWVRMEHKEEQKRAKCQPIPLCKEGVLSIESSEGPLPD